MKEGGLSKPKELFAPNVLQKSNESNSIIQRVLEGAGRAIGAQSVESTQGIDIGKHWIRTKLGYDK